MADQMTPAKQKPDAVVPVDAPVKAEQRRLNWWQQSLVLFFTLTAAIIASVWIIKVYLFPAEFKPVTLDVEETQTLERKLQRLDVFEGGQARTKQEQGSEELTPEAYSEAGVRREITFTERELNALLARNTDLAHKVAIDLAEDLLSGKLLMPVDEDFPILGGQTIRVRAGLELAYADNRPRVILKGVTVMGVPMPNAWLGGMKNIDLIEEFGEQQGFWQAFADGVDSINVVDGQLNIKLKE